MEKKSMKSRSCYGPREGDVLQASDYHYEYKV